MKNVYTNSGDRGFRLSVGRLVGWEGVGFSIKKNGLFGFFSETSKNGFPPISAIRVEVRLKNKIKSEVYKVSFSIFRLLLSKFGSNFKKSTR